MTSRIYLLPVIFFALVACKKSVSLKGQPIKAETAVIVNGGDNSLSLFDLKSLEIKGKINLPSDSGTFAHHASFSSSGRFLSVALPYYDFSKGHAGLHGNEKPGKLVVLNTTNGHVKLSLAVPKANFNVVVSPDEKEIWTAGMSHSGRIYVYDLETGKLIKEIVTDPDPSEIVFSPDGRFAIVACEESSFVTIIDVGTKKILKEIKVDPSPGKVWPGYDQFIFVENQVRKTLNIVDLKDLKAKEYIDFDFVPGFPVWHSENQEIWVCAPSDDRIYFYKKSGNTWKKTGFMTSDPGPYQIAFFDNGKKATVSHQTANSLLIVDTASKKIIKKVAAGKKPNGIAVLP